MRTRRSLWALLLVAFVASHVVGQVVSSNPNAAIKKGNELVAQGQYEEALKEYERVTANDGELYATAVYNTGVCYYELWQSERAISFYKLALKLREGRYPRASYALGVALEDTGRLREAKKAYQNALRTAQHPLASFKLGRRPQRRSVSCRNSQRPRDHRGLLVLLQAILCHKLASV